MVSPLNPFLQMPPELTTHILRQGLSSSLRGVCTEWNTLLCQVNFPELWQRLKGQALDEEGRLSKWMRKIEIQSISEQPDYFVFFRRFSEKIAKKTDIKVAKPFSFEHYLAIAERVELFYRDCNLLSFGKSISSQFNLSYFPQTALGISTWLNNPVNGEILQARTSLSLIDITLSSLPCEIEKFKEMTVMFITKCKLKIIPSSFGTLSCLQYLSLTDNRLHELPNAIGNLTSLKAISLRKNSLKELPQSFWELRNLSDLNLSENRFSGSLPLQIENLTQLKALQLSNNYFSALPLCLERLSVLNTLSLEGNSLMFIPEELLSSTQPVFSGNPTLKNFKDERTFRAASPLAKYYQAFICGAKREELNQCYHALSVSDIQLITDAGAHMGNYSKEHQWPCSVRVAIIEKYNRLPPEQKFHMQTDHLPRLADTLMALEASSEPIEISTSPKRKSAEEKTKSSMNLKKTKNTPKNGL